MKILHTADWHLGKRLFQHSRFAEQEAVMSEIVEKAEREQPDVIIVAGDVFDHFNPSDEAKTLFYNTVKALSRGGACPVVVIAGNHDSAAGVEEAKALAYSDSIFLIGMPDTEVQHIVNDFVAITRSDKGYFCLEFKQKTLPALHLLHTPYTDERRLKRFLGLASPEDKLRELLEAHWMQLVNDHILTEQREAVTVLVAHHYFMLKGDSSPEQEDEEERSVLREEIGGAQSIFTEIIPPAVQYVALGHLHRAHNVSTPHSGTEIWYSGSPLQYSFSESGQKKYILMVDLQPNEQAIINKFPLSSGKELLRVTFDADHREDCHDWLSTHADTTLVELTLRSREYLLPNLYKDFYLAHEGIVNHPPHLEWMGDANAQAASGHIDLTQDIADIFSLYYQDTHNSAPDQATIELFKEIVAWSGNKS